MPTRRRTLLRHADIFVMEMYIVCVYCFTVVVLVLDVSNNLKTSTLDSRLYAAELMTCWEQTVWILYILVSF
jgi:hypothetical protein